MLRQRDGVTLVELLIVMTIVVFVLTAASQLLSSMIVQFKQQTKIAETSIESTQGLEILRRDIKGAGFGLPRSMPAVGGDYNEAVGDAALFNDKPKGVPRAIIANNPGFDTVNDSDYLVIKSLLISQNAAAGKWHFVYPGGQTNTWTPGNENLAATDRVIVLSPKNNYRLCTVGSYWYASFGWVSAFKSSSPFEYRIAYGVRAGANLRFPFNRADYYISSRDVPKRCAPGTGVLVRAEVDHGDGDFDLDSDGQVDEMPLLDCVADMQVVFLIDTDEFEGGDALADHIDAFSAEKIRETLGEVRVYILAHEGQKDPAYQYPLSGKVVNVGAGSGTGRGFDLETFIGEDWREYRWKLYTLVEIPEITQNPR